MQTEKKKYRRNQRSSLSRAAAGRRTWRLQRSGRDWALSLAPRLGGRPSLELHLRTRRYLLQVELGGSRPRPGPRGGHASHRQQGPSLLHHSARRGGSGDSKDDSSGVGFLDLVHEAAAAANVAVAAGRDPRRSLHIGRGTRTAPGSPPRRLQPRCSLRWLSRQASPAPDRGGPRRKYAGRQRREGAGSRPRRTAVAPLAPQSLTPRSPGASAAPHCPAIFSALHTRTPPPPSRTAAAAHGTRPAAAEASANTARPRRRPAHTAGPVVGPSPSASPPSPPTPRATLVP